MMKSIIIFLGEYLKKISVINFFHPGIVFNLLYVHGEWTYSQSSGQLKHNGILIATGYAGRGTDKNNPQSQCISVRYRDNLFFSLDCIILILHDTLVNFYYS